MTGQRRRSKSGIRQFAEQVTRRFRWVDRVLGDPIDAFDYLAARVVEIEKRLEITPPPPPKPRTQREREERLRVAHELKQHLHTEKTAAPSGDAGADSTPE